jgi:Tetratricopeptide repeat
MLRVRLFVLLPVACAVIGAIGCGRSPEAKKAHSESASLQHLLDDIYINIEDVQSAEVAYLKAVELDPIIHYHLGMAYHNAGELVAARKALSLAVSSTIHFAGKEEARRTLTDREWHEWL